MSRKIISAKRILVSVLALTVAFLGISSTLIYGFAEKSDTALTPKEELSALYEKWKDTPSDIYTAESFAALQNSLQSASLALNGSCSLTEGGSWYYHRPKSLSFIPSDRFESEYGKLPWDIEQKNSSGDSYTQLTLINDAYGFYRGNGWGTGNTACWPMIFAEYDFASPIEIDFSEDTLDLIIRFYDATHLYETGRVMLNFEGVANYSVEIANFGVAIGGGKNTIKVDLKSAPLSNDNFKAYLESHGNKAKLVSVSYCNTSVVSYAYKGTDSNPNPAIDLYGFNLTVPVTDDDVNSALESLKNSVSNLVVDTSAIDLKELTKLYNEYADITQGDYTATSYRKLQTALKTVRPVIENKGISYSKKPMISDGEWQFAGKNSTGELLRFRSQAAFSEYYSDFVEANGMPFDITEKKDGADIVFNRNTLGFYHSNTEAAYWGQPIIKYDLSQSPVELDFKNGSIAVDVNFIITDFPAQQLPASISLFFKNIGEWIELQDVSGSQIAGHYSATIDLRGYYEKLDGDSAAKTYLDSHDGKDKLIGIAFRFSNIMWSNNNFKIEINEFAVANKLGPTDALALLKKAVDGLEKQSEDTGARYESLKKLYEEYSALENNSYSDRSWNDLQSALALAKKVVEKKDGVETENKIITSLSDWEYGGRYVEDASSFYSAELFKYTYNTDKLPTSITEDAGTYKIVPVQLGFYGTNKLYWGYPKQRYNAQKKAVVVDFNTDTLTFDINFSVAPDMTEPLEGEIILTFENIGKVSLADMRPSDSIAGHYEAVVSLSDYYSASPSEISAVLDTHNGIDTLLYAQIEFKNSVVWSSDTPDLTVQVNGFSVQHNLSVVSALNMLKTAYTELETVDSRNFIFDNIGKWYIKEPNSKEDKMVLASEYPSAFGIYDQRNNSDKDNVYYRLAFQQKGLYELPEATGTYKIQYSLFSPIKVDFKNDAFYIDLHASYVGQQNQDVKFYVDLYFKGYNKPVRLSTLYSNNSGLSKGRVQLTANLYEFMAEAWNTDFKNFVARNGNSAELQKVELSATYTDVKWKFGGDSILVRDFSVGKAQYPTAEDFTLRVKALADSDYVTTLADRYEINRLEKDYGFMKPAEKKKLAAATVKKYNKLAEFIHKAEKNAYFFENEFSDYKNWLSTGGTNPLDLVNTLCPITDPKAYLEFNTGKGSMEVSPTGLSAETNAFMGGAVMGWFNLFYYCDKPHGVSIKDSVIYYDVESDVDFQIVLQMNESNEGIVVLSSGPGTYTGTLDLAAFVNALSDEQLKKLGIYNNSTAYITTIRFQHNNKTPADMSYGRKLNIRTLAVSEDCGAYLDPSKYHKAQYKVTSGALSGVGAEIVQDERSTTYNTVLQKLRDDAKIQAINLSDDKTESNMLIWISVTAGTFVICAGAVLFLILFKRRKNGKIKENEQ